MVENCLLCACFLCYILDVVRKGTNAWRFLANLTSAVSDGCLAAVEGRLWLVGGQQGVGVTSIVLSITRLSQVSILGPASHRWKEDVAEEPADFTLATRGLKPGEVR